MIQGLRRTRELLERVRKDLAGECVLDVDSILPEYYRMQTPEMLTMLDNAQTDFSFDGATRHNFISLMAFESRAAACLSVAAEQVAGHEADATPEVFELFQTLDQRLEYILEQLENPSIDGAVAAPPLHMAPLPEWLEPMQRVVEEAGVVAPNINTFAVLKDQPDFGTETLRNLKQCLPNIFPLVSAQAQHARAETRHQMRQRHHDLRHLLYCDQLGPGHWLRGDRHAGGASHIRRHAAYWRLARGGSGHGLCAFNLRRHFYYAHHYNHSRFSIDVHDCSFCHGVCHARFATRQCARAANHDCV